MPLLRLAQPLQCLSGAGQKQKGETNMRPQPPIKCTSTRVTINGVRYRVWSDGSVSRSLTKEDINSFAPHIKTLGDLISYEKMSTRFEPHSSEAKSIRQEAARLRRNRNARERNQALRDMGMKKTAYGWE